jgi:hypothetical protein
VVTRIVVRGGIGAGRVKRPYRFVRELDLYTEPPRVHTVATHLATVVHVSRHDPHEGELSMLIPRPTGDHPLDWHITMRLNRAAVDALEIERGIAVLGRLAQEEVRRGVRDPPDTPSRDS